MEVVVPEARLGCECAGAPGNSGGGLTFVYQGHYTATSLLTPIWALPRICESSRRQGKKLPARRMCNPAWVMSNPHILTVGIKAGFFRHD
eukprot:6491738-Amphidinium_carterae.1